MRFSVLTALFTLLTTSASAGLISFADGWRAQRLSLFSSNDYRFESNLSMMSDGS